MDWNNGSIFRIYVVVDQASIINSTFTTTVNIDQQLLNGKVFMGIENLILKPVVNTAQKQDYWAVMPLLQLSSINLPPYIDYSSFPNTIARSENTKIFARIPITILPTIQNTILVSETRFGFSQLLNKDSIVYEMINNPNAISNGKMSFRVLDSVGNGIPDGYINLLYFTLVIYKHSDNYSK